MTSKVFLSETEQDLTLQINNAITKGFNPTFGFVCCSYKKNIDHIISFYKDLNIQIVGSTTSGEISDTVTAEESIVTLLMDMDTDYYHIYHNAYNDKNEIEIIKEISETAAQKFDNPSFVLISSGVTRDGELLVQGIKENISKETKIFGGLSGDDGIFKQPFSFSLNGITDDGVVALILDGDKIDVAGLAVSGWEGNGAINTITKANGNMVYTINNQDALSFFVNHFGLEDFYDKEQYNYISMPGNYPLKMLGSDQHEKLRSIMNYDQENKALLLAGSVEEGQSFMFCLPPSIDVIDNAVEAFRGISKKQKKVDAIVMISCMARKLVFGPLIENELEGIKQIWDSPIAGFFAYGELGKTGEDKYCNFHNCTSNLITFTEISA